MEKVDLEYEYITESQDSTRDIDMGIEMIKRGEQKLQFTFYIHVKCTKTY